MHLTIWKHILKAVNDNKLHKLNISVAHTQIFTFSSIIIKQALKCRHRVTNPVWFHTKLEYFNKFLNSPAKKSHESAHQFLSCYMWVTMVKMTGASLQILVMKTPMKTLPLKCHCIYTLPASSTTILQLEDFKSQVNKWS